MITLCAATQGAELFFHVFMEVSLSLSLSASLSIHRSLLGKCF